MWRGVCFNILLYETKVESLQLSFWWLGVAVFSISFFKQFSKFSNLAGMVQYLECQGYQEYFGFRIIQNLQLCDFLVAGGGAAFKISRI